MFGIPLVDLMESEEERGRERKGEREKRDGARKNESERRGGEMMR